MIGGGQDRKGMERGGWKKRHVHGFSDIVVGGCGGWLVEGCGRQAGTGRMDFPPCACVLKGLPVCV